MAAATQAVPQPSNVLARIRYGTIAIELLVGCLYIALNFPHLLTRFAHPAQSEAAIFAPPIDWLQTIIDTTVARVGTHAFFQMPNIVALLFVEVAIYLFSPYEQRSALLLSMLRARPKTGDLIS
jgi:hypothetical protein